MAKQVMITLVKSPIGSSKSQKDTLKALGCTKIRKCVTKEDNVMIQGMIKKVAHLVEVKDI
ncbi:50S ribosomal protein L30 [Beduini massiliensis]|uniref:50S ribosomal protein L30 n=1 Tax=Beduini massiliensis TaxID=1585974 RepID=UPI00059A8795|nr:50S ribosomal protein L30 [Beduini massiliensis]